MLRYFSILQAYPVVLTPISQGYGIGSGPTDWHSEIALLSCSSRPTSLWYLLFRQKWLYKVLSIFQHLACNIIFALAIPMPTCIMFVSGEYRKVFTEL